MINTRAAFVVFWLCYGQITNNLVSQAGQTDLYGIPNDAIQALNPVACILLGPIVQGLYWVFSKKKIAFRPIARITVGFIFMSTAMAYAAGFEQLIYNAGPCYEKPLDCPASNKGLIPNKVNGLIQTPVYFMIAISEIFALVTAIEYTYSKAPKDMKAMVQAISQLIAGFGAAVGMAISPISKDPYLVAMYAALAGAMAVGTGLFWWCNRRFDGADDELNRLDVQPVEARCVDIMLETEVDRVRHEENSRASVSQQSLQV